MVLAQVRMISRERTSVSSRTALRASKAARMRSLKVSRSDMWRNYTLLRAVGGLPGGSLVQHPAVPQADQVFLGPNPGVELPLDLREEGGELVLNDRLGFRCGAFEEGLDLLTGEVAKGADVRLRVQTVQRGDHLAVEQDHPQVAPVNLPRLPGAHRQRVHVLLENADGALQERVGRRVVEGAVSVVVDACP